MATDFQTCFGRLAETAKTTVDSKGVTDTRAGSKTHFKAD